MGRPTKHYFDFHGRRCSLVEIARETGIGRRVLHYRLAVRRMSVEDAVKLGENVYNRYTLNGIQMTFGEIEKSLYLSKGALRWRAARRGTTLQEEIDKEYAEQRKARGEAI